ncbi:hypothetical protein GUJ93_ZPchr0013g37452 [Zizania palustris]|uniref:Uncharacterized protein n=1 Tax=Zizania palustris TaxID=103762 RepID=A0A8J5WTU7_ZIZPA|nr:hypothetical protein GUJ93_ZPchr0013g37452 [Zizania palustris]
MITRAKLVEQLREHQIRSSQSYSAALAVFSPNPHIASRRDLKFLESSFQGSAASGDVERRDGAAAEAGGEEARQSPTGRGTAEPGGEGGVAEPGVEGRRQSPTVLVAEAAGVSHGGGCWRGSRWRPAAGRVRVRVAWRFLYRRKKAAKS